MICFASECEYMHSYFLLISENLGYNEIGLDFLRRMNRLWKSKILRVCFLCHRIRVSKVILKRNDT